jgi:hypothetical protein
LYSSHAKFNLTASILPERALLSVGKPLIHGILDSPSNSKDSSRVWRPIAGNKEDVENDGNSIEDLLPPKHQTPSTIEGKSVTYKILKYSNHVLNLQ